MALMMYLVLGVVGLYLFRINPLLCVGVAAAVLFFKIRGAVGRRHSKARAGASPATEAALVSLCITLIERADLAEQHARSKVATPRYPDIDPLDGLFLEDHFLGGD